MPLTIQANCNWQQVGERRKYFEQQRHAKVARLRADIDRISKREMEHTKSIIEEMIPVKLVWDKDAWERVKDFIPVKVEIKQQDKEESSSLDTNELSSE